MVQAYAAANNLPLRTARDHRQKQKPEWMAFINAYAGQAIMGTKPESLVEAPPVPSNGQLLSPLQRAQSIEREAWLTCEECTRQKRIAQASQKADLTAAWIKCEAEAAKNHREALRHRIQLEQQEGRLIPASQIDDIRTKFLSPVRDIFRTAAAEIAAEANPLAPHIAKAAIEQWFHRRLNPALRSLSKALPAPTGSMVDNESIAGTGEAVSGQNGASAESSFSSA
jgi:hypothetical protein